MEYKFIKSVLETRGQHFARKYNYTYRYIDDLLHISDVSDKSKADLAQIFDSSLSLGATADLETNCEFLDLDITVTIPQIKALKYLYSIKLISFSLTL